MSFHVLTYYCNRDIGIKLISKNNQNTNTKESGSRLNESTDALYVICVKIDKTVKFMEYNQI